MTTPMQCQNHHEEAWGLSQHPFTLRFFLYFLKLIIPSTLIYYPHLNVTETKGYIDLTFVYMTHSVKHNIIIIFKTKYSQISLWSCRSLYMKVSGKLVPYWVSRYGDRLGLPTLVPCHHAELHEIRKPAYNSSLSESTTAKLQEGEFVRIWYVAQCNETCKEVCLTYQLRYKRFLNRNLRE